MNQNIEPVLRLSKEGARAHYEEIARLENELLQINTQGAEASEGGVKDGFSNSVLITINNERDRILAELKRLKSRRIEIVEELEDSNLVDVKGTYQLHIEYADGEVKDYTVRLTGGFPQLGKNGTMEAISINSPIGKAIYGKPLGTAVPFKAGYQTAVVTAVAKIAENTEEDQNE